MITFSDSASLLRTGRTTHPAQFPADQAMGDARLLRPDALCQQRYSVPWMLLQRRRHNA